MVNLLLLSVLFIGGNAFTMHKLNTANKMLSLLSTRADQKELELYKLKELKDSLISNAELSRIDINELLLEIEALNPTSEPARSPLLNGVWELRVSGFGSPGLLGYQLIKSLPGGVISAEDLSVVISSKDPRVEASTELKVATFKVKVTTLTDLEATSGTRLSEKIESAKIGKLDIFIPKELALTRNLLVTFLDEDLLIVRDEFGSPEILKRKSMAFGASSLDQEPSSTDDSGAPGAG